MAVLAEQHATAAETTTTSDPGTAGTSLAVTTRTGFPGTAPFWIVVQNSETDKTNREYMRVTGGVGTGAGSFTVTRAQEGTTGVAHASGSYVALVQTASGIKRWMPEYLWQPRHNNCVCWVTDPTIPQVSGAPTTRTPVLGKVYVPEDITITNLMFVTGATAGATLTAGGNRVGVYNSSGTLLAQSADITSIPANTVVKTALSSAQAITGGVGTFIWLALLISATTMPTVWRTGGTPLHINVELAAADGYRSGTLAQVTSGNSLPSSFTPSTDITSAGNLYWLAAS